MELTFFPATAVCFAGPVGRLSELNMELLLAQVGNAQTFTEGGRWWKVVAGGGSMIPRC